MCATRVTRFVCSVCGRSFTSKSNLKTHQVTHTEERPHVCAICGMRLKTKVYLKHHMERHVLPRDQWHRTLVYRCLTCLVKFVHVQELRDHIEATGHIPKNQCTICKRILTGPLILQRHMEVHVIGNPFKCDHCDYSTEWAQKLRHHMNSHTAVRNIPCPECDKMFSAKRYVVKHVKQVHRNITPTFLCFVCGKSLKTKDGLAMHMTATHSDHQPYECFECDKLFKTKNSLTSHLRIHGSKDVLCAICGKSYYTKARLAAHMSSHSEDTPFECKYCGKRFKRQQNMDSHMRTHTGQRKFKCDICDQAFKWKHILSNHLKSHGITRIESDGCCKCFDMLALASVAGSLSRTVLENQLGIRSLDMTFPLEEMISP